MTIEAPNSGGTVQAGTRGTRPSRRKVPVTEPQAMPEEDEPTLTTGQAAALAGVDPVTLRRWCGKYKVPHLTLPSGRRRFPERSFHRWIRETFEVTEEAFR